uniref:Uncharacterized protein n=1 Tax=Avena sativa TaxID=4498 RepID=A0ACD6ACS0_AVESA
MVAGCVIAEECALAVSADRTWKACCSGEALLKACAGVIDAVDVEGDGGPGTVTTLKLSVAASADAGGSLMRSRTVARDDTARVLRSELLQGGKVSGLLKSEVTEVKIEAAGEGGCVVRFSVEYERLDGGGALGPEDQAALAGGHLGLLRMVEAYLVANPTEYV